MMQQEIKTEINEKVTEKVKENLNRDVLLEKSLSTVSGVETPSGKGAKEENFPVGSWLLPADLRYHVKTFYAFARAVDDIADNPSLLPQDKVDRLEAFERALLHGKGEYQDFVKAYRLRESCAVTGVSKGYGAQLLTAFKQDAVKTRYTDWNDLLRYCSYSAAPVGRFMIDLHGEHKDSYPSADALCNTLQILNHIQDCRSDYLNLDRVYLPLEWMEEYGGQVEDLGCEILSPGVSRVIQKCLDGTELLLETASTLPYHLRRRRLRMEVIGIVLLAKRLLRRLRSGDPLAGRVSLSKRDFVMCGFLGMVYGLFKKSTF